MKTILMRALPCAALACGVMQAHAQSVNLPLNAPQGQTVRLRWPDTTLVPERAGRMVSVSDGTGRALDFTFAIAPEDQGHAVHPLWLVVRLDGPPPYAVVADDNPGQGYRSDWTRVVGDSSVTLASLPLATTQAPQAWGPLTARLQSAEAAQSHSIGRWNRLAIGCAFVGGLAVIAGVAFFARHQVRKEDVTRL